MLELVYKLLTLILQNHPLLGGCSSSSILSLLSLLLLFFYSNDLVLIFMPGGQYAFLVFFQYSWPTYVRIALLP